MSEVQQPSQTQQSSKDEQIQQKPTMKNSPYTGVKDEEGETKTNQVLTAQPILPLKPQQRPVITMSTNTNTSTPQPTKSQVQSQGQVQQLQAKPNITAPAPSTIKPIAAAASKPVMAVASDSSAPTPAMTAAMKPQFQVLPPQPKPSIQSNIKPMQHIQQPNISPQPHLQPHHQQSHSTTTNQPIAIKPAPKLALKPKPIQISPSPSTSLPTTSTLSSHDKPIPCIITSKQWVLPPRPKAGRKPDKKKSTKKKEEVTSVNMGQCNSHGVGSLSDTLTNLNIKSAGATPANSIVSSLVSCITPASSNVDFVKISKAGSTTSAKNSISINGGKQKELKSQLECANQENVKLKSIIDRLKMEIEQLQASNVNQNDNNGNNVFKGDFSGDISMTTTQNNSPSPLSNPLTTTTTNSSVPPISTPQNTAEPSAISIVKLETPPTANISLSDVFCNQEMISPTIDPTKIDMLIQENYKMDLLMKQEQEKAQTIPASGAAADPEKPVKKKRTYKKKKKADPASSAPAAPIVKQELSPVDTVAPFQVKGILDDTPSPLTSHSVMTTDSILSDLPNLSSILEDSSEPSSMFSSSSTIITTKTTTTASSSLSPDHFLQTINEEELYQPFKKRSLKLERSVSLSDPVITKTPLHVAELKHKQQQHHHLHSNGTKLSRSMTHTPQSNDLLINPFINEDSAMLIDSTGLDSLIDGNGNGNTNWDLMDDDPMDAGLSRATTLTTVDWDEEEGRFVNMGSYW